MKSLYQHFPSSYSWYGTKLMPPASSGLAKMLWMTLHGSRYQTSYSVDIHSGVGPSSGTRPLYRTVYDCQGTLPNLIALIVAWRSWWSLIGALSSWGTNVVDQTLNSQSMVSFASEDVVYQTSAISNAAQDVKGFQLPSSLGGREFGGIPGGINSPSQRHICP